MKYFDDLRELDERIKSSKVSEIYFDNVKIFTLLRNELIYAMLNRKGHISNKNHRKFSFHDIYNLFISIFGSIRSILKINNWKNKPFFFIGFSRRIRVNGKSFDKFHDPLIDALDEKDCVLLEKPFLLKHSENRATKCSILDYDLIVYLGYFISLLISPIYHYKNRKKLHSAAESINLCLGIELMNSKKISFTITKFKTDCFFADIFINIISPKKLVVTSRWLHYPFILCAKKKGIETIELQHGAILRENPFYRDFDEEDFSVDIMMVFGAYWQDYPWNTSRCIPIGVHMDAYPYLEKANRILVISQPELDSQLAKDIFTLALANNHLQFDIKLHPQDLGGYQQRYSKLIGVSNIYFIDDIDLDVKSIFSMYQLVLGYNSTVLFEAHFLGASVGVLVSKDVVFEDYVNSFGKGIEALHIIKVDAALSESFFKIKALSEMDFFDEFDKNQVCSYMYEKNI